MRLMRIDSVEEKVLAWSLIGLGVVSIAIPVLEPLLGFTVSPSWNVPIILFALYALVRLVGPLPEIRTDVKYLREVADVRVERMPNVADFYDSLNKAVSRATSTLDLTHIRDHPPADFGVGAGAFFDRLADWCTAADGRSIRRVICVRNPQMYSWARALADDTRNLPQFKIRVIAWGMESPALNMAILDGKAVYLAISGSTPERMKGLGIEDSTTSQYFAHYYENLWAHALDLEEWLQNNTME